MDTLQAVGFRDRRWSIAASRRRSLQQAAEALNASTLTQYLRDLASPGGDCGRCAVPGFRQGGPRRSGARRPHLIGSSGPPSSKLG